MFQLAANFRQKERETNQRNPKRPKPFWFTNCSLCRQIRFPSSAPIVTCIFHASTFHTFMLRSSFHTLFLSLWLNVCRSQYSHRSFFLLPPSFFFSSYWAGKKTAEMTMRGKFAGIRFRSSICYVNQDLNFLNALNSNELWTGTKLKMEYTFLAGRLI